MEHLDKDLAFHSAHIVIQRTHMIQPHSEVLVNNQPFDFTLPTESEVRLVKYWDEGKGLKGHRYGQVSAKIVFVDYKFYAYAGPGELKHLFIKTAEQWLASKLST